MTPSQTQLDVIRRMLADGRRIERLPGGFWTTPSTPRAFKAGPGCVVPEWWVGVQTLKALARMGVLQESRRQPNGHLGFVVEYRLAPSGSSVVAPENSVQTARNRV